MSDQEIASLLALAEQFHLPLDASVAPTICHYCQLLWAHNAHVNLTRHVGNETFVTRDLIDCFQLASVLTPGERILDVGSGGGVPGIVLAILRPDLQVTLSESVGKKASILSEMVSQLGLSIEVRPERAELVLASEKFGSVTARAVGPLWKILHWFSHRWDAMERLLLVKGPRWVEERAEARHRGALRTLELRRLVAYDMPGHDGQSVILSIWPK